MLVPSLRVLPCMCWVHCHAHHTYTNVGFAFREPNLLTTTAMHSQVTTASEFLQPSIWLPHHLLQASGDLLESPTHNAAQHHHHLDSRQASASGRLEPASASSAALFAAWAGSGKHAEWRVVQWVVTYLLPQLVEALRRSAQLETGDSLLRHFAAAVKTTCQTFGRQRAQLVLHMGRCICTASRPHPSGLSGTCRCSCEPYPCSLLHHSHILPHCSFPDPGMQQVPRIQQPHRPRPAPCCRPWLHRGSDGAHVCLRWRSGAPQLARPAGHACARRVP